jgi:hypothetical protein
MSSFFWGCENREENLEGNKRSDKKINNTGETDVCRYLTGVCQRLSS